MRIWYNATKCDLILWCCLWLSHSEIKYWYWVTKIWRCRITECLAMQNNIEFPSSIVTLGTMTKSRMKVHQWRARLLNSKEEHLFHWKKTLLIGYQNWQVMLYIAATVSDSVLHARIWYQILLAWTYATGNLQYHTVTDEDFHNHPSSLVAV